MKAASTLFSTISPQRWCRELESHQRHSVFQTDALLLSYTLVRHIRIELINSHWKCEVLPLKLMTLNCYPIDKFTYLLQISLALHTTLLCASEKDFIFSYGRRKTATARVRLYPADSEVMVKDKKLSKGDIYVNDLPIEKYFSDPFAKSAYTEVFRTTNTADRFITTAKVEGSGKSGQLGAVTLAIARALCIVDPKFKPTLRKKGFMTRDPRAKERKKPGLMGARKKKSSPKR